MKRVAAVMLTVTAAASSCGGTRGSKTFTREQFVAGVANICDEMFEARMRRADPGGDRTRIVREHYLPAVRDTLEELDGIEAPGPLRREYRALVEAGQKGLDNFERLFVRDPTFAEAGAHPDPWESFRERADAFGLGDHCAF